MPAAVDRRESGVLHPFHAALLAGTVPLFIGTLLCDLAYNSTFQIQWKNFASWLLVGALVYGGFVLLWALIDLVRARNRGGRPLLYFAIMLATWILGFINALVHAKDTWASMPTALILSVIVALLAIAGTVIGLSARRAGDVQ